MVEAPAAFGNSNRQPSDAADDRDEALGSPDLITHDIEYPEQAPRQFLFGSYQLPPHFGSEASQAETRSGRDYSAVNDDSPAQTHRSAEMLQRSASSRPLQSKRTRPFSVAENKQPPKRARHNTQHSTLASCVPRRIRCR